MTLKTTLVLTLVLILSLPALMHPKLNAADLPASTYQTTLRMLGGCQAMDVWDSTFVARAESVWVVFAFYNPDSTDTLDLAPSAILFVPDVLCTVWAYGAATGFIDEDRPSIVKANEALLLPAQIDSLMATVSAAGLVRIWAYGD